jgi:electron transport complex protein RnfB
MNASTRAAQIDRLLPQTQCTKCGYAGCAPYAQAIVEGAAAINQCPPGGAAGIAQLAALLGITPLPLNPAHGVEAPRRIAFIDEAHCIGCTLCIQACPVDAIIGAAKQMHTVLSALCSGCDLCVAPCPVDCIEMRPALGPDALWDRSRADAARTRHQRRQARLQRDERERLQRSEHESESTAPVPQPSEAPLKQQMIQAAIERARARRATVENPQK